MNNILHWRIITWEIIYKNIKIVIKWSIKKSTFRINYLHEVQNIGRILRTITALIKTLLFNQIFYNMKKIEKLGTDIYKLFQPRSSSTFTLNTFLGNYQNVIKTLIDKILPKNLYAKFLLYQALIINRVKL